MDEEELKREIIKIIESNTDNIVKDICELINNKYASKNKETKR